MRTTVTRDPDDDQAARRPARRGLPQPTAGIRRDARSGLPVFDLPADAPLMLAERVQRFLDEVGYF